MAASYPSSLPVKDAAGANLSSNPHSTLHDDMYDEIVAIATELGTNPKGTSASVKAKLDLLDVGAWTSYTPTVIQTGSVTVTNTRSRYARYGRTIMFQSYLTVTGSGSAGAPVYISLPVTADFSSTIIAGTGQITDSSALSSYVGWLYLFDTTNVAIVTETAGRLGQGTFTAGLAVGDSIYVAGTYEAAA